jgi:hypothetical protein
VRGAIFVAAIAAALAGCGDKSCQNSCRRVYDTSQCAVQVAGATAQVLIEECTVECKNALQTPGGIGTYNPYERAQPGTEEANFTLETEIQAATWMDCVWDLECEQMQLDQGLCWPIP